MLCNPGNASIAFGLRQIFDTRAQHASGDQGNVGARVDDNDAPRTPKRGQSSSMGGTETRRTESRRRLDFLSTGLRTLLGFLCISPHNYHVSGIASRPEYDRPPRVARRLHRGGRSRMPATAFISCHRRGEGADFSLAFRQLPPQVAWDHLLEARLLRPGCRIAICNRGHRGTGGCRAIAAMRSDAAGSTTTTLGVQVNC